MKHLKFAEYRNLGLGICAIFHDDIINNRLALNKRNLELRIKNLKDQNLDTSVEEEALKGFPQ